MTPLPVSEQDTDQRQGSSQENIEETDMSEKQPKNELSCPAEDETPGASSSAMDMQSSASSSRNSSSKPGGYSGDESSEISDECDNSSNPSNSLLITSTISTTSAHDHDTNIGNQHVIYPAVPMASANSKQTEGDASISSNNISLTSKSAKDAQHIMDRRPLLINPVDPRIDLSCLNVICAKEHDRRKYKQQEEKNGIGSTDPAESATKTDATDSYLDAYSRLLESCQPFFKIYQEELKQQQTSHVVPIIASAMDTNHSLYYSSSKNKNKREYDDNDSVSSMIVLAPRPKNRRKKMVDSQQLNQTLSTDGRKKVKPSLKHDEEQQLHFNSSTKSSTVQNANNGTKQSSSCSSQSSSSATSSTQTRELLRLLERGTAALQHRQQVSTQKQAAQDPPENHRRPQQGPRLVSESSGLNSGSATGTGSGSGTGSGNDTYAVKQDDVNSTEITTSGDANSNSDALTKRSIDPSTEQKIQVKHSHPRPSAQPSDAFQSEKMNVTQERIALKKRKRMDQRKEIEDMVRRQMQTSSDSSVESVFKPGDIISMEDSLSFADTARLIVQAEAPYCAVHVNAAFSRLTGIHNSSVIGTPVSKILSLVSTYDNDAKIAIQRKRQEKKQSKGVIDKQESFATTETASKDPIQGMEIEGTNLPVPTSDALISNPDSETVSIDPLIASCEFNHYHQVRTLDVKQALQPSSDGCSNSNNGSNNSSISSKDENIPKSCIMSICAVHSPHGNQSSTHSSHINNVAGSKKQKSCDTPSHYLIQLFPLEGNQIIPENISQTLHQSSTSSSRLDDDSQSGTSTASKPVAACG